MIEKHKKLESEYEKEMLYAELNEVDRLEKE